LLRGLGGKGANQAVMAARLGAKVTFLSAVGDDEFGRLAVETFRDLGIDTSFIRRLTDQPTGTAAILVDAHAENAIVVVPGANAALSVEEVRAARDIIASADIVVAQLETPIDSVREAFRLAREAGVRTLLNPAPIVANLHDLLTLTDICIPNETEMAALTQMPADTVEELRASALQLSQSGPRSVIVTRGSQGAFVLEDGRSHIIPAVAVQAVDPTAAGDAFVGAVAVFLATGQAMLNAVRQACVVAALTVTRPGAQSSFPTREEINSALKEHGGGSGT
jgi:ribokinase